MPTKAEYNKQWQKDNPEKMRQYYRDYYRRHPERAIAKKLRKYGLTIEKYKELLDSQAGGCAICGAPPTTERTLDVDHDHTTGAVRGLLCNRHNVVLGLVKDSTEDLQGLIRA